MAILSNLLVNGESRLLGKLYTNDIDISGTAVFANLSTTGNATIGGTLGVTGATTQTGKLTVNNVIEQHGDGIELYYSRPHIDFHYENNSADYTSRIIETAQGVITITPKLSTPTADITTANITTANTNKINNADMITTSAIDVKGKLHAVEYDLENIMDLGGSFVVAPTLIVPSSGSGTKTLTVSKSNDTTVVLTVKDPSITSTGIAGFAWANNYKVKVSGLINNTVLGTCDGYINSTNISSNTISLTVTMDSATVTAIATTVSNYKLNIMLYNTDTSSAIAVTKPLGIYLQHYQLTNNPIINVWNGQTTTPKVRIGYLGGITYNNENLGTNAQNSWGLYSDNVFLEGQIVAKGGKIAGWTIGDGYITTNSNRTTYDSTSYNGMTMTESGIGARGSASAYFNLSASGGLTAVGATITTATIGSGTNKITLGASTNTSYSAIKSGLTNRDDTAHDGFYIGTDGITLGKGVFKVTNAGAVTASNITATGGKVGGWSINGSYGLYTNNKTSIDSTNSGLLIQKDGGIYAGAYDSTKTSCPFQVTSTGALTARSATISGNLTATSLSTGTKTASETGNGTYIDGSGNIYVGNGSTNNFTVTNTGALTAVSATLKTVSLTDENNKERALVNANGLIVKDANDNTIASLSNDLIIGQESANLYNVKIDADTGVLIRKNNTTLAEYGTSIKIGQTTDVYTDISSSGIGFYKGGSSYPTFKVISEDSSTLKEKIYPNNFISAGTSVSRSFTTKFPISSLISIRVIATARWIGGAAAHIQSYQGFDITLTPSQTSSSPISYSLSGQTITLTFNNTSTKWEQKIIRIEILYNISVQGFSRIVGGVYPEEKQENLFTIGNGTSSSNRNNSMSIDMYGHIFPLMDFALLEMDSVTLKTGTSTNEKDIDITNITSVGDCFDRAETYNYKLIINRSGYYHIENSILLSATDGSKVKNVALVDDNDNAIGRSLVFRANTWDMSSVSCITYIESGTILHARGRSEGSDSTIYKGVIILRPLFLD